MKKLLIIGLLFFCMVQANAQENLNVNIKEWAVNGGMQPAYIIDIPQSNSKDAIKLWEKTLVPKNLLDKLKKMPKMDKEENNKWVMKDVIIDNICADTLDVYTRVSESEGRITFVTLFDKGGKFIDGKGNDGEKAKKYVREFAVEAYKEAVQNELDGLEKEVKKMEKQTSNIENDNKKIARQKAEVNSSLENLKTELGLKRTRIQNGGDIIDGILQNPLTDEEKEVLKDAIKGHEKDIKKAKKDLEKFARNVDKNDTEHRELEKSIKDTEAKVKAVQTKLGNIK